MILTGGLRRWLLLSVLLGVLAPAGAWWWQIERLPSIRPDEVSARLAGGAVLLDISDGDQVPPGALHLPADELLAATSLPAGLAGRPVIVLCKAGLRAAQVTAHLNALGATVFRLDGGSDGLRCAAAFQRDGQPLYPRAAVTEPAWKQALVLASGLVVKPAYMLLTIWLIWRLRRTEGHALRMLRLALVSFLVGETACGINIVGFHEGSVLLDYLHGWGMALGFSAGVWGLFGFAAPTAAGCCSWVAWCRPCTRPGDCRLDHLLPLLPLTIAFLACLPLTAGLAGIATTTTIFGQPYAYRHEIPQVLFELRLLPFCALLWAAISLVLAWRKRTAGALAFSALAAGPLSFALLRLLLGAVWQGDPAWFLAWEELAELASLLALWRFFAVFPPRTPEPRPAREQQ